MSFDLWPLKAYLNQDNPNVMIQEIGVKDSTGIWLGPHVHSDIGDHLRAPWIRMENRAPKAYKRIVDRIRAADLIPEAVSLILDTLWMVFEGQKPDPRSQDPFERRYTRNLRRRQQACRKALEALVGAGSSSKSPNSSPVKSPAQITIKLSVTPPPVTPSPVDEAITALQKVLAFFEAIERGFRHRIVNTSPGLILETMAYRFGLKYGDIAEILIAHPSALEFLWKPRSKVTRVSVSQWIRKQISRSKKVQPIRRRPSNDGLSNRATRTKGESDMASTPVSTPT